MWYFTLECVAMSAIWQVWCLVHVSSMTVWNLALVFLDEMSRTYVLYLCVSQSLFVCLFVSLPVPVSIFLSLNVCIHFSLLFVHTRARVHIHTHTHTNTLPLSFPPSLSLLILCSPTQTFHWVSWKDNQLPMVTLLTLLAYQCFSNGAWWNCRRLWHLSSKTNGTVTFHVILINKKRTIFHTLRFIGKSCLSHISSAQWTLEGWCDQHHTMRFIEKWC